MKRVHILFMAVAGLSACTSVHPVTVPTPGAARRPDSIFMGRHVEVLATEGYFEMTNAYAAGDSLFGTVATRERLRERRSIPLQHVRSIGRQSISAGKVFAWTGGILAFMLLVAAEGFR